MIAELDQYANMVESGVSSETVCSATREDSPVAGARDILVDAGEWLRTSCFREPVVPSYRRAGTDTAWKASLARAMTEGNAGIYTNGELFVDYDYFVGEGGDAFRQPNPDGMATLPHELFHAIQANYHDMLEGDWHAWIVEGTAEAVEVAWRKKRGWGFRGRTRYFDDPLHRPRGGDDEESWHAYRTSIFWLWLGRKLASTDEIAYLHDLFETGDFLDNYGLNDFETFLDRAGTGLYHVFPEFIAERANLREMYDNGDREVTIRYREPEAEEQHRGRVRLLAADPVTVTAEVPDDKFAEIEIRIEDPAEEELHLIVGDEVYSKVDPDIDPLSGMSREQRITRPGRRDDRWRREHNRFVSPVGGGEPTEFFVRVAYAKPDHRTGSAEVAMQPESKSYKLDIRLVPLGTCDFTASISGDTNNTSARGNVAHFSTTGGATIQGMMSNPGNMDRMAAFLESMSGGRMNEEERERMRETREQWQRELEQLPTETLGLSLIEMDTTDEESALAAIAGGFKLQLSVFDQPIEPGFSGALKPGRVMVHPGDWTESFSQQIRYEWAPGAPGDASLNIRQYGENLLTGTLSATLHGQGVYKEDTGEAPVIDITAAFRAVPHDPLRGELGCITRNDR